MKRLLVLVLAGSSLWANAQTNYPGNIPGCVARYDFAPGASSSILDDVSGNNNVGLMHNMTATNGWRAAGSAMLFNGANSYAQVSNSTSLSPQTITMIALVRFDGFYTSLCQANMMLGKGYPNGISGNYTLHVTDQAFDNDCNAFHPSEEMITGYLGNASLVQPPLTAPVQTGKWYFMALSFDGTQASCYQQMMDSTAGPATISPVWTVTNQGGLVGNNTQDLFIGRHPDPAYPYWLNGALDELAIFNRKLTAKEIQDVYEYLWQKTPTAVSDPVVKNAGISTQVSGGMLQLKSSDNEAIGNVTVLNAAGQKVSRNIFQDAAATIDVRSFPNQILFIRVLRKNASAVTKAVNW